VLLSSGRQRFLNLRIKGIGVVLVVDLVR
jgi:hypothetical protein